MKKENKYRVQLVNNGVIVWNNRTGSNIVHHINEFVFGTALYNKKTEKYPNYVHKAIWELKELQWEKEYNKEEV